MGRNRARLLSRRALTRSAGELEGPGLKMKEYILYKLANFAVIMLPLRAAYGLGSFLSFFYYHFLRKSEREILKENLRAVFPEWSEGEIRKCARRNFREFGRFLAEFFYIGRIGGGNIEKLCAIKNFHYIEEAASRGRGVIAVGAHMGNWELGGVALALAGCPVTLVALDHKSPKVNELFIRQRMSKGVRVVSSESGVREIFKVLRRGEFFAILGDRDVTSGGVEVEFFGRPAVFPRGAAALCFRTGAPMLPGMMAKTGGGRYNLIMHKPFEADYSLGREAAERKLLDEWVKLFEEYVRAYPEIWFMYHRVWE